LKIYIQNTKNAAHHFRASELQTPQLGGNHEDMLNKALLEDSDEPIEEAQKGEE
jgi:hypothetical protein